MEDSEDHHELFHGANDAYKREGRLQLPNFDQFVRTLGHRDIVRRGSAQLETELCGLADGQPSLPTPPAVNGPQVNGFTEARQEYLHDFSSLVTDEGDLSAIQFNRRTSFAQPRVYKPAPRFRLPRASTKPTPPQSDVTLNHEQVVREESVPGKGVCFVYGDGSTCPKEINGDAVNPKWGTTKAGKPRKRLGQACNACREKKIKCDPGFGKCAQCLRFTRVCSFEANARQARDESPKPRTSTDSSIKTHPDSPQECFPLQESLPVPTAASTPLDIGHVTLSRMSNILSPLMSDRDMSHIHTPSKRQRTSSTTDRISVNKIEEQDGRGADLSHVCQLEYAIEVDPVTANEKLTRHYLDTFFDYINLPNSEIFSRRSFMQWALNNRSKTLPDRIMLYALMAWATLYSKDANRALHRATFKSIVYQEIDDLESQYCLRVVHTLLFVALAEFIDNQYQRGFSMFARCVGAISFLQLNIEQQWCKDDTVYDLSPTMYAECRRRTYWVVFCADTYAGLSRGQPRMLHNDDVFLRLPCAIELYEEDRIPTLPIFDPETVLPGSKIGRVGMRSSS